jgi:exonuclease SbcC
MRILSIRLKNINSLRGEHELFFDRSPLKESGLFGIVGATGSGKSTLLDCITLALYGRVPRIGLISKTVLDKGGVILTKHEKECYAEVRYACKQGVFTAFWSAGRTRNNTFRGVEMRVFNEAGELLSENLSTAADVNTTNIGLDYDQFIKSILLCQGDFAKFLQSDRNKRAELLEKITGTKEFRKIGQKAFRAYSRRNRELEVLTEAIGMNRENVLGEDERKGLEGSLQQEEQQALKLQKQLEQAKAKLELKRRLKQLRDDIEQKEKNKEQADEALRLFNGQHLQKLRHYDQLFPFKEDLLEHQRLTKRVEDLRKKISDSEKEINAHNQVVDELVSELKLLVNDEVSEADYFDHLEALRDKVMDLLTRKGEQRKTLRAAYDRLQAMLHQPLFQAERGIFRPKGNNEQLLMKLRARTGDLKLQYESTLLQYKFNADQLAAARVELVKTISDFSFLVADVRSYADVSQKVKTGTERVTKISQAITEQVSALNVLRSMVDDLDKQLQEAEKEKQQLLNAEKLDQLRSSLVEGEPCPLCGSEHHPYLHEFAETLLKKNDTFEAVKKEHKTKKHELEQLELAKRNNDAQLLTTQQDLQLAEEQLKKHSGAIQKWKEKLNIEKISNEEKVAELLNHHKAKLEGLDLCLRFQADHPSLVQLDKEVEAFDGSFTVLENMDKELQLLYAGDNFQQVYQRLKDSMTQAQDKLKLARQDMRNNTVDLQTDEALLGALQVELSAKVTALRYQDIVEARTCLISESEQKQLVGRQKELASAVNSARSVHEALLDQLSKAAINDDVTVDLATQEQIVSAHVVSISILEKSLREQRTKISSDDMNRKEINRKEEQKKMMEVDLRPWEMLNRLIGDKNGNKFNTMAQELTLQQLLIFANRRMDKLHSRYKLLLPERLDEDDLRVADGFMGGEVRTVKSLSGGETFVISLALALGLSDLAARDIRIDSLFVDEGFGSLDPDTLEEAMSTLEQLQTESNKTVGIISHVESLKERIYTQIRLEKSNNGFSSISIFPEPIQQDEPAEES